MAKYIFIMLKYIIDNKIIKLYYKLFIIY